ncbi:hypothetical protein HP1_093 [Candidatus Termititenax spirochaetophilus]|uniref:Uncharacterized protein n=1 Tax=Candidatus Termititenax spirochaetophilus TaxID=2218522 RepID=A0A388T6R2_9BACT|nr:hypothetical protein HP1_093 [Candidatus Termititenax spirochaetophilus]
MVSLEGSLAFLLLSKEAIKFQNFFHTPHTPAEVKTFLSQHNWTPAAAATMFAQKENGDYCFFTKDEMSDGNINRAEFEKFVEKQVIRYENAQKAIGNENPPKWFRFESFDVVPTLNAQQKADLQKAVAQKTDLPEAARRYIGNDGNIIAGAEDYFITDVAHGKDEYFSASNNNPSYRVFNMEKFPTFITALTPSASEAVPAEQSTADTVDQYQQLMQKLQEALTDETKKITFKDTEYTSENIRELADILQKLFLSGDLKDESSFHIENNANGVTLTLSAADYQALPG